MVYFIGAGPGNEKLITLLGLECLKEADVIIYAGSLVNPKLLEYAKDGCEIFDSSRLTLDEVIEIVERADSKGQDVARLHTGDISLYSTITEQIEILKGKNIPYALIPGVSSFSAAAVALELEYTLPDVSQSLIISRVKGRTDVPKREALEKLAEHGCSMVLFLSAALADEVQRKLLSENSVYDENTPCAIVYKASWDDEKIIRTRLGQLSYEAEKNNIKKTALLVISDALKPESYEKSRLYSPDFTTGCRTGTDRNENAVISFTDAGVALGDKIKESFTGFEHYSYGRDFTDTKALVGRLFKNARLIIFIGACGMAVRLIAPFIRDKALDPAVLCVDDTAGFVISLLSGHLGGANEWCKRLSKELGAVPVITTATDNNGVFAVDTFAKDEGFAIDDTSKIKDISSAALKDKPIGYFDECGINFAKYVNSPKRFKKELRLYPKNLFLGMGCKKNKSVDVLFNFVEEAFREYSLPLIRICGVYSIDDKANEKGLIALAERLNVSFITYSSDELRSVNGSFRDSEFVENTVGVANVCERAAMRAAAQNDMTASLLIEKRSLNGMTLAVAQRMM